MTSEEYLKTINATEEEIKNEEWRNVIGYERFYQISSLGRIRSLPRKTRLKKGFACRKGKILRLNIVKRGNHYLSFDLKDGDNKKRKYIHQLVLECFVGLCPQGMECCHNDGNSLNNRLSNLRWDTHAENMIDSIKQNKTTKGEKNSRHRLKESQVKEIILLLKERKLTQRAIAKKYGVIFSTINHIAKNKTWTNISR